MSDDTDKLPSSPIKWDEARLQSYIDNKVEESLNLDYKAPEALGRDNADKITKTISAFANSTGGIVIYGLCEFSSDDKEHLAEKIAPIDRREFSREWLEQIIGRIQPRLSVVIHPVQLSTAPEHVAYVVEIPQGIVAHQATDFKYYKRHNFQSVPMHDYEIRDVNRRKSHPLIKTDIRMSVGLNRIKNYLIWHVKNESDVMARWVSTTIDVPSKILGMDVHFEDGSLMTDAEMFESYRLQPSNLKFTPLFPGADLMLRFDFTFAPAVLLEGARGKIREIIKFKTFADEMTPQEGFFELGKIIVHSPFSRT